MNNAGEGNGNVKVQRWAPFTFWRWTSLFLASYGVGNAILVVLVGLALGLRMRSLLLPYLLLLWCGFVGASLIYWARQSYERPRSGAIRFTLAIFFLLNLYMGVLVFSAYRLGLLTQEEALYGYAPYILPGAVVACIAVYFTARRRLEAISRGWRRY
jgi:hypothetical protein